MQHPLQASSTPYISGLQGPSVQAPVEDAGQAGGPQLEDRHEHCACDADIFARGKSSWRRRGGSRSASIGGGDSNSGSSSIVSLQACCMMCQLIIEGSGRSSSRVAHGSSSSSSMMKTVCLFVCYRCNRIYCCHDRRCHCHRRCRHPPFWALAERQCSQQWSRSRPVRRSGTWLAIALRQERPHPSVYSRDMMLGRNRATPTDGYDLPTGYRSNA